VDDQWWADRPSTPSYRVSPCLWPHVVAVCHHHHHHHHHLEARTPPATSLTVHSPPTPAWATRISWWVSLVGCPTIYTALPCPTVSVAVCWHCVPPPPRPSSGLTRLLLLLDSHCCAHSLASPPHACLGELDGVCVASGGLPDSLRCPTVPHSVCGRLLSLCATTTTTLLGPLCAFPSA